MSRGGDPDSRWREAVTFPEPVKEEDSNFTLIASRSLRAAASRMGGKAWVRRGSAIDGGLPGKTSPYGIDFRDQEDGRKEKAEDK